MFLSFPDSLKKMYYYCIHTVILCTYSRLLLFRLIGRSHYGRAVGLTYPTEVTHGFCDNYLWNDSSPDCAECRIRNLVVSAAGQCCTVLLPHLVFCGAGWQQLYICALIAGDPSWKEDCVGLRVTVQELYHPLCVWETYPVGW